MQDEAQEIRETRLNFHSYLNAFAHNTVISNYTFLLKTFKDNRAVTNQQIVSLFEKIAKEFTPLFYQVFFLFAIQTSSRRTAHVRFIFFAGLPSLKNEGWFTRVLPAYVNIFLLRGN